jgi:hypothetical protein
MCLSQQDASIENYLKFVNSNSEPPFLCQNWSKGSANLRDAQKYLN